jgi:hypothetical protein
MNIIQQILSLLPRWFSPGRKAYVSGLIWVIVLGAAIMASINQRPEAAIAESVVTPSPTSTAAPISLTIFRDADTLTLYIAEQSDISLIGFAYTVNDRTYPLDDFASFREMPFGRLPTPICFRLIRSGSNTPLPQDCASALVLTHLLSNADIFWYGATLAQDFVILIESNSEIQGICPSGEAKCEFEFIAPTPTPTPVVTPTPTPTITPTPTLTPTPVGSNSLYIEMTSSEFRSTADSVNRGAAIFTLHFVNRSDNPIEIIIDLTKIVGIDNIGNTYGEINGVAKRWCDHIFNICFKEPDWSLIENFTFIIPAHDMRSVNLEVQKEGSEASGSSRVDPRTDWIDVTIPVSYRSDRYYELTGTWRLNR